MHLLDQNFCEKKLENNVCLFEFRSKHRSNTVLCLLRNLMKQTLHNKRINQSQQMEKA